MNILYLRTISASVHHPAVLPDLPLAPCQRRDVPHLDHGRREALEELGLAVGEPPDDGRGGFRALLRRGEHRLVGPEQAAVALDVVVVAVVERVRRGRVEVVQRRAVVVARRAALPERGEVPMVQRRVRLLRAAEVVEPVLDGQALRAPDRVRPCEVQTRARHFLSSARHGYVLLLRRRLCYRVPLCAKNTLERDEIGVVEADVGELLLKITQRFRGCREVLGAVEVGRPAVPPAQHHLPVRTSCLLVRSENCRRQ